MKKGHLFSGPISKVSDTIFKNMAFGKYLLPDSIPAQTVKSICHVGDLDSILGGRSLGKKLMPTQCSCLENP